MSETAIRRLLDAIRSMIEETHVCPICGWDEIPSRDDWHDEDCAYAELAP